MKLEEVTVQIRDWSLHRVVLRPDSKTRGTLHFFHGQGDYIDRYPPLLSPFVDYGFTCILTDLPGHGRSPGPRGHVPGMPFLDSLLDHSLTTFPGPHLIAGHSMGGLMALHFLLSRPGIFKAAWLSSPLLEPMRQARPWMRILFPPLAQVLPWFTTSTGVSAKDCTDESESRPNEETRALYHSAISLGWGITLRDLAANVTAQFLTIPTDIPILFTQGAHDTICPASLLNERLAKLPANRIIHEEVPEARHEPFAGSTGGEFQKFLSHWIKTSLADL